MANASRVSSALKCGEDASTFGLAFHFWQAHTMYSLKTKPFPCVNQNIAQRAAEETS
jgi:hypothetical protein